MQRVMASSFRPEHRLRTRRDFDRVFERADRKANRYLTLLTRRNDRLQARLGLVVSRRVSRRAVDRNRIKRLVREGFRRHRTDLAGLDLVAIPRPSAAQLDNKELTASLDELLRQLARDPE